MKNAKMTILVIMTVLVMAAGQGFGWTQYKDGGTHNISSTINDDVWVDYQAPGMSTTVNVLNGGKIGYPYTLEGYNSSNINVLGGSVDFVLYAYDNSKITLSSGSVYSLNCNNLSQTFILGASVGWVSALGSSEVVMSGGNTGGLYAHNNSLITVSGGTVGSSVAVDNNAKLIIKGSNFAIDGNPVNFGTITSILGAGYSSEPYRRLTGTLANGDIINDQFQIGNYASITLVPEPATLLLLGLGAVMLRRKR